MNYIHNFRILFLKYLLIFDIILYCTQKYSEKYSAAVCEIK